MIRPQSAVFVTILPRPCCCLLDLPPVWCSSFLFLLWHLEYLASIVQGGEEGKRKLKIFEKRIYKTNRSTVSALFLFKSVDNRVLCVSFCYLLNCWEWKTWQETQLCLCNSRHILWRHHISWRHRRSLIGGADKGAWSADFMMIPRQMREN